MASQQGVIRGTLAYMSPEQARGRKADTRTDIFSFGAVLYEMLTGRRAFGGDTSLEALAAVLAEEPKSLHDLRPDLPPKLSSIVQKALAKQPENRYQRIEDPCRSEHVRQHLPRSGRRLLVAACLLIALVVAGGVMRTPEHPLTRRDRALPEIARLAAAGDYVAARSRERHRKIIPAAPQLAALFREISRRSRLEHAGAAVEMKEYTAPDDRWISLGKTHQPDTNSDGVFRWRVSNRFASTETAFPTTGRILPPLTRRLHTHWDGQGAGRLSSEYCRRVCRPPQLELLHR
jgi:hypothetical protein